MAILDKPTKRTKHIETRHFALQSWIEIDLLQLKRSPIGDKSADALTKTLLKLYSIGIQTSC